MEILVIDDSKSIRCLVQNLLNSVGHTVSVASDGNEAADFAAGSGFDLIVSDIIMPKMDGLDLARHLRSTNEYKKTPIIFLTTESSEELRAKGKEISSTTWIKKPFSPVSLLKVINILLKKLNVLAVDDSKSIRCMVSNILTGAGHTVTVAADGREAIGLAAGSGFDLIITDVNMPEMDGLDLARQLRNSAEYSSTPIIFLTTEATEDYMAKGKEIGTTTWITKPFSPVNLLDAVSKV